MKILTTPNFASKLLGLFFCLIFFTKSYAQVDKDNLLYLGQVKSDSTSVASLPILESKNEIEIWFWRINPWSNPVRRENGVYKLFYSNNEWIAVYRSFVKEKSLKTIEIDSKQLESIFGELVANKIFYLDGWRSLPQKEFYYDKKRRLLFNRKSYIEDASTYNIIYKIGSFYRRYKFYAPEKCYSSFPNIDECRYANNIVKIFEENFYAYKK